MSDVRPRGGSAGGSGAREGRHSVAFPRQWWYPACRSRDLGARPRPLTLMDEPFVLFRDARGVAHALADRCPHRNVPLSIGKVAADGCVECRYHGWRFDGDGRCRAVPGLLGADPDADARSVTPRPVRESDGFVWIWGDPTRAPYRRPPVIEGPAPAAGGGRGRVVFRYDLDATIHAACENDLDVAHTAFLHAGIWRGGPTNELTAVRREISDGVEVEYLGEPVGMGGLRMGSRTFEHRDRFLLPSTSQIEYRVDGLVHVVNTVLHLPLSPLRTRAWFDVRFWTRLPAPLAWPVVLLRGHQIARQDVRILREQTCNVERFGGERYTSTELDVIGNAIWRLLRQAERAEARASGRVPHAAVHDDGADEHVVRFRV